MKVVLSADALDKGRCSRQWCIGHLGPGDTVVAVAALPPFTGYMLGVPLVDQVETEHELLIQTDREYCEPIRAIGAACDARIVPGGQARAVVDLARAEHADLIVIAKRPHSRLGDAVWAEAANRVVHHPPCPVVVVPAATRRADAKVGVAR
ncbi:MAG TPA: universal stress protein [Acidimicrobiales bacterium]|jgi:nucleotide-binding universal stress UspA family protein